MTFKQKLINFFGLAALSMSLSLGYIYAHPVTGDVKNWQQSQWHNLNQLEVEMSAHFDSVFTVKQAKIDSLQSIIDNSITGCF